MGLGSKFCKTVAAALVGLVVLVGLAITGVAIYAIAIAYREGAVNDTSTALWVLWTPFVFGLVVTLAALLACCTTLSGNKWAMGCFALLELIFGLVIVAAGAALMIYSNYLEDVSSTSVNAIMPGIGYSRRSLSDYTIGIYVACCIEQAGFIIDRCPAGGTGDMNAYCYYDWDAFNAGAQTSIDACVASQNNFDLCPDDNSDTGAGIKHLQREAADYFQTYLWPAGVTLVVLGSVLLLIFLITAAMACCGPKDKEGTPAKHKHHHAAEAPPPPPAEQAKADSNYVQEGPAYDNRGAMAQV
mmetsp:Transcript_8324/g.21169  ORF Transcript_8324/g.21169 Transcript_8324/m.21169 type:complete len:300 (+) Transcript_8324:89-988(+)|eukprot:CAMPEP_0202039854 /NCGR_PEP_ID=MMETSP0962-20130828/18228_1 /ASSEMBLY_ACC=CAM_ASM_000488 /TAXON_ID=4773 /ORGANISM="Schizochytrium aggregatum, Strain ATCC28209" /LENGTH=299 /DNA_ID=CAMNT_0048604099 /DNA_START=89 /DNA_END=988 /DNA_ORIENTATION=+